MARKRQRVIATCFDKKGRVLAVGENSYTKTHPLMFTHGKRIGLDDKIFLHAEVQAILRCGDKKIYSILVERYSADGAPLLAKPCPVCESVIRDFRIPEVMYTTEAGVITEYYF